jgi:type I restriction enzyme, S subunit
MGIPFINVLEVITHPRLTVDRIPGKISLTSQLIKTFKVESGDVLFNRTSETQEEVGLASVYLDKADVVFGGFVIRGKPNKDCLDPIFCSYILRFPNIHSQISSRGQGAVRANIGQKELSKVKICVPLKSEQEAIAHTLSDIDALIELLDRLLTKKRQIKQGAMQELLRSKEGWVGKSLGEIGRCLRGVSYNPNTDIYSYDTDFTVRLLRSNNIQKSNLVFTDLQFVDSVRMSESQQLRSKDIVICMANGSKNLVGKAGKFSRTDEFTYTFGSFMGCFRGDEIVVDQDFVFYLFQTNKYKIHIANLLAGSSINNLCPSSIESFSIPIPSTLEEQIEIASILSDMDAEIDSIESKLTKTRQLKQGMMHELLTGRIRLVDYSQGKR